MEQLPAAPGAEPEETPKTSFRSLKELVDFVSGRQFTETTPSVDAGFAEKMPFPFLALVGQYEMKMALLLTLINPALGGVLLIGPRGTGKTTAVRSLLDLLPQVIRSTCFYGCLPEDIESGGIDAVCPECARKYGENIPFTTLDRVRIVELPLNTSLPDVIGSLIDSDQPSVRMRLRRGLLAQSDRNILFIDEVNLLSNEIVDAILDAAAQGAYTLHQGTLSATYRSRFTLIGSMNPEEGNLRPQIMDRFGLRVIVKGLNDPQERLEAYKRVNAFTHNPRQAISHYAMETSQVRAEIQHAREILPSVEIPGEIAQAGICLINQLRIDSLRAEITLFEAARAHAAANDKLLVDLEDIKGVAQMSLRMRQSRFMDDYFAHLENEEKELISQIDRFHVLS